MNPQESKKLETKILTILKQHIQNGDTVVAGISGGPDSIFLLELLKKLSIKIIAAHVNHQLRKEADGDEEFVSKICVHNWHTDSKTNPARENTTIIFSPLTSDIKALSQKSKQGLEETGRKVRYDFFNKLAKKYKAKFIITAHHADDNLETIILNFARGASLQGLAGMQEIETTNISTASLLRPLLTISKKEIIDFLHFNKVKFRVDKSNNSLVYKRNFIRHKIIPLLKEINPSISSTLSKNTENLREINEFLKSSAKDWLKKNAQESTFKKFDAKNFRTLSPALQKNILLQLHTHHVGNTQNIQSSNIEETLILINKNIGNKKKKFGKLTIFLKNNIITIV
ncbi:MAG: tRNA lysidine(34) synthetase TilS [Candidatus Peregrinibacteria bacterium]|nr:tRNA lysidine(34) synthetase TilS [Candidatus Peregrinibacteria bacterium]